MIRYLYNRQYTPPAPFAYVTVCCPETSRESGELPALLDTGADRSVLPSDLVEQLGFVPLDEVLTMTGYGGHVSYSLTFLAVLTLRQLRSIEVQVVADPNEPYIILGRDVLNHFHLVLEGPKLAFEIGP